jgi:rubrerythrin
LRRRDALPNNTVDRRSSAPMSDTPSYVKVLNAIAVGERRGQMLFDAWANATHDAELRRTLATVAIREGEHAAAFTKRLCELGYEVRDKAAGDFPARLAKLRSNAPDVDKFESVFGYGRERPDAGLGSIFDDTTIDPATGALLGRFIAEERDTRRRLETAYARLKSLPADEPGLAQITQRLERLTQTIEELKALRRNGC